LDQQRLETKIMRLSWTPITNRRAFADEYGVLVCFRRASAVGFQIEFQIESTLLQ
jgi:hypothetical protein